VGDKSGGNFREVEKKDKSCDENAQEVVATSVHLTG